MSGLLRTGAALAATALLLVPAIWNGFPLLQYDTGGYLARWFEGYLVPSRSTVYGLFITVLARPDFWPVVIVQSALTVWVLALVLRALGFGGRPLLLLGVTALLSAFTTLPFLSAILLTDVFAGLAVLALHPLLFEVELRWWERGGLVGMIAFAVATHSATFVVVAVLLAVAVVLAVLRIGTPARRGIATGALALALGALLLLSANLVTSGRLAWTPGGFALSFGRMLQDGIVARYLAEHCPDRRFRLCHHRSELPRDADAFFWGGDGTVFNKLGRFKDLDGEMRTIVIESLRAYPTWQAEMALAAVGRQLVRVATGEGVVNTIWHSYAIVEKFTPSAVAGMRAARQQRGELDFAALNLVHRPVALGAMLLLLPLIAFGLRRDGWSDVAALAGITAGALLANAVVCGILSNPHDRYGARLAWIAPLVIALAVCRLRERAATGADKPATARA